MATECNIEIYFVFRNRVILEAEANAEAIKVRVFKKQTAKE